MKDDDFMQKTKKTQKKNEALMQKTSQKVELENDDENIINNEEQREG